MLGVMESVSGGGNGTGVIAVEALGRGTYQRLMSRSILSPPTVCQLEVPEDSGLAETYDDSILSS